MDEIWKDVVGLEGFYKVSNLGNIKSLDREIIDVIGRKKQYKGKILTNAKSSGGYFHVEMKGKNYRVHRVVAMAFIENKRKEANEINHKNGIKTDNRVENLEWCTSSENSIHAYKTLGIKPTLHMLGKFGKDNPNSKKVVAIKDGIEYLFYGLHDAQRKLGLDKSNISAACRGVQKTCGGYTWKFVEQ